MSKRIAFINFTETFTGFLRNNITAAREWIFQDRSGTLAHTDQCEPGLNGIIVKGATLDRYYGSAVSAYAPTTGAISVNNLRAFPFPVTKSMTLDAIQAEVTTLVGGSNFRLGIYADDGNCYPGVLLHDTGSLSGATNEVVNSAISPGLILTPGLYWLAIVADAAITFRSIAQTVGWSVIMGRVSSMGINYRPPYWNVTHTYGALPNPFTTGAAINNSANNIIEILVRASA